MSSGLMSCVRENSPPLDLDMSATGPLSLPVGNSRSQSYMGPTTSTPNASPVGAEGATNDGNSSTNAEQQQQQQKRRRFHPLRNLRRIFRRRTINSADSNLAVAATGQTPAAGAGSCNTLPPPASSSSEKNLRSAALSGCTAGEAVSASSPASPLTHQQLRESYQTQSLPKSKSYGSHRDELLSVLLGKKRASKQTHCSEQQPVQNQSQTHSHSHSDAMYQTQRQQLGVAVFPDPMSMSRSSYFQEKRHHQRQLRSVGDSSQELDVEDSGPIGGAVDMSDSQRSLSEARLLDADVEGGYTRETLSQSHDSVFSESATASSLSIVLKAELTDVLRKRRTRPDASDEDLGLPRSPASPQRHVDAGHSRKTAGYQARGVTQGHEVSSLSLVSVNSTDGEDSQSHRQHNYKSSSSSVHLSSDILRFHQEDDVDAVGLERQRLSHAAAKHKMAIRPAKKKVPSRLHRRTLETPIPEANEEFGKLSQLQAPNPNLRALKDADLKSKTRSLPPGSSLAATITSTATANPTNMRSKTIEQKNATITNINSEKKTSTSSISTSINKTTSTTSSQSFGLRALTFKAANGLFDARGESSTDGDDVTTATSDSSEPGFLRRLIQRNSKRSITRANDGHEDVDSSQNVAKKLQISTSCLEATSRDPLPLQIKSRSATSHEQHIQETRQIIKREIHNEGKNGLNAMVSNFGVQPQPPTAVKPKSGPAARQRYMPQELGASSTSEKSESDVTSLLSKSSRGNDTFQSTALVREQSKIRTDSTTTSHFERKPRIVGLSAFQQKLSRSSDSMGQHSSSSNSLETSTDEPSALYYEEKQRKTVEKSRSFRNYQEDRDVVSETVSMQSNMPSLPDLSISFRVPTAYFKQTPQTPQSPRSPMSPMSPMSPGAKCVSLGFEINDNKLLQARTESTGKLPTPSKISPQRSTKLLLNSPAPVNISQIEQNIDLIVKSPLVSVLRKSNPISEQLTLEQQLPPQRPKVLELKQTTAAPNKDLSSASPLAKNAKLSSSPPSTPGKPNRSMETSPNALPAQPEFMKIQLNRVDHSKANHLVLTKNVKPAATPTERSQSSDDLSMRRLSNESTGSIQIIERTQKPPSATTPLQPHSISQPAESLILARQQRAVSANSLRSSYLSSSSSCSGGSSEVIAAATPATTPSTPKSGNSKPVATMELTSNQEKTHANRYSLEERKRLFLSEEKSQVERKLNELRNERKKSIGEELQRKIEATPTANIPITPGTPNSESFNGIVVLRKKSLASANGNCNNNTNSNGSPTSHDDPTPELMKVFARRSLKVKDDDVVAVAQLAVATHKKITNGSQSVDSDKENQSNSEEKLDKLTPKYETQANSEPTRNAQVHTQTSANNRSSVADFRNLNNNNQPAQQKLSQLPPIKVSNVRQATAHSNNNNNSSNQTTISSNRQNNNVKPANERYSLQLKQATPTSTIAATTPTVVEATAAAAVTTAASATPTKPIERSATVGEFKGIHQRRAEWEQRVKEALK